MLGLENQTKGQIAVLNQRLNSVVKEEHALINERAAKWGTTSQRLRWVIQRIVLGVEELVIGCLLFVLQVFLRLQHVFLFIFFGVVTILLRAAILLIIVMALKNIKFVTDVVNLIIVYMNVAVNAMIGSFLSSAVQLYLIFF